MPERPDLDELRREAEAAITGAGTAADLEELRVRYLGRKSALTQVLRSIGELSPEERERRAKHARSAHMARLALLSAKSRSGKRRTTVPSDTA